MLPIQKDADSGDLTSFTVVLDSLNVANSSGAVQYSQSSLSLPVILDSGTTLTYLPDSIANSIASGVGASSDGAGGLYVPCDLANTGATVNFIFGNSKGPQIQVQVNEFVVPYGSEGGQQATLPDGKDIRISLGSTN